MKKVLFDGTAMQGSACTVFHGGAEYAKFIFRESLRRGFNFDVVVNDRMVSDKLIEHLLCQSKNVCVYHVNSIHEIYVLIDKNNYDVFYSAPLFSSRVTKMSLHLNQRSADSSSLGNSSL